MNSLLPLLLMMSGFNKKDCDGEKGEGDSRDNNGLSSLLPLLFLTGGFGGGLKG